MLAWPNHRALIQSTVCAITLLLTQSCAPRVLVGPTGLGPINSELDVTVLLPDASARQADAHPASESTDSAITGPNAELLRTVEQVTQRMVQLRGLRQRQPMSTGILTRDQILERLRARVAEEYHGDELAREGALYRAVGLWADPREYVATTFALLEEQVAGYYDPTRKQLFLASWLDAAEQTPTLAHELTHALQDQHFDIGRFVHHERLRGDAQIAAMAVVEGDATLAMLASVTPSAMLTVAARVAIGAMDRQPQGDRLAQAPLVLRESLMFPYRSGLQLCTDAYQSGGWAAINQLLQTPPVSSEQVMHPTKLAQREPPVDVALTIPPVLSSSHELSYEETLGELGVQLWLRTWIDHGLADEAAEGWGGDHAMLLVSANLPAEQRLEHPIGLWKIVADPSPRDTDARQLEHAAVEAVRRRFNRSSVITLRRASLACVQRTDDTVAFVARRASTVVIATGVPRAHAAAVLNSLLAQP
jgi:hypothetical protein